MGRFDSLPKAEMAAAAFVVLLGIFIASYSFRVLKIGMAISPDAGFMPFLLGLMLTGLGISWFTSLFLFKERIRSAWDAGEGCQEAEALDEPETGQSRKHIWGSLLILLYAFLLERAGFLFSTLLFMFLWQWIVEKAGWLTIILASLITGLAMYSLFQLILKIYLPAGAWFS
jgi:hypothetical protein